MLIYLKANNIITRQQHGFFWQVALLLKSASQAWSSHLVTDINKLEAYRRFTKRLKGMKNMDYPSRLKTLAIDSLQKRRVLADLI